MLGLNISDFNPSVVSQKEEIRPVGTGGVRGAHAPPPPSQKGPPDGIVKDLKW